MGKQRAGPKATCPKHPGSKVVAKEIRQTSKGPRSVFRCTPKDGKRHTFTVVMAGPIPVPLWSPPPPCPTHDGSRVVRDGFYGTTTPRPRQRYRCWYLNDEGEEKFHRFTPWLPRDHVHTGTDSCNECHELRGTHRGEPAISRRQAYPVRVVAEALRDLSRGRTYAAVGKDVREGTGRARSRRIRNEDGELVDPPEDSTAGSEAKSRWHTAADWVEVYGPVLWDHQSERLRQAEALAVAERERRRAAGKENPNPLVIAIDSLPIHTPWINPETAKASSRPMYFVLVVIQVVSRRVGDKTVRENNLRLVRAYPNNDALAWKLVLAELGYTPDFILSDADDGQNKAINELYAEDPNPPVVIPSLYHVRFNVEEALRRHTPGSWVRESPTEPLALRWEIEEHLSLLSRQHLTGLTRAGWALWWDELEEMLTKMGLPLEPCRRRRKESEQIVADVLDVITEHPDLPLSTGGVEIAIRSKVDPVLAGRAHAFANITRTNRLFDLVVCNDRGMFNDMPAVIELLQADSAASQGWSPPLRTAADPQPPGAGRFDGRYASLRDALLLRELATARGVA